MVLISILTPSIVAEVIWCIRLPTRVMVAAEFESKTRLLTLPIRVPENWVTGVSSSAISGSTTAGTGSQTANKVVADDPIVKSDRSAARVAAPPSVADHPAKVKPVLES